MNSKTLAALGLSDFKTYISKYFLPIFLLDVLILLIFIFGFDNSYARLLGYFVFICVFVTLFAYPIMIIDSQTRDIEENLHYFITYAGALSTVNLERKEMFTDLSEKKRYKEISNVFRKLIYLVEAIKVDFATSAYKVSSILNTEHFSRFLERMGIALSFNANIGRFLIGEQKVLMRAYENVYVEGLERIRTIQDLFVSLVLAFSFGLAIILLLPFLTGTDSVVFLQFGLIGIVFLDAILLVMVKFFLPKDNLYHDLGMEPGRVHCWMFFGLSTILALITAPFVLLVDIPFMMKVAIIMTPYLLTGFYANTQEAKVKKRDILFPAFIRSLGDVHQSKGGTLTTTIETLLPHNFGILDDMLQRLYKRLKITSDKFTSWFYFSKESGSALISEFTDIFVTVVYRGGSAAIAGEIVSDNMEKINGLRDQKREFASTLRGNIFGTFFGLALTIYISQMVAVLLFDVFTSLTSDLTGAALDLLAGIFPTSLSNDSDLASIYIGLILLIHATISAYILKDVDGGNKLAMFQDLVIMLWMGAAIELGIVAVSASLFASYA
jgi:flagellar protein FlaJ